MWSRVVWLERDQDLEGVMPSSWVRGGFVMWPPGVNASKAMKEKKTQKTCRKFKLIKVTHQSGINRPIFFTSTEHVDENAKNNAL